MRGSRRVNIDLANKFHSSSTKIEFVKVEHNLIGQLMNELKQLKNEVEKYYTYDLALIEKTEVFIKTCRKVVDTFSCYSSYFEENDDIIREYFSNTKRKKYEDLFNNNIQPIINILRTLREEKTNSYIKQLTDLTIEYDFLENDTYIVTKKELTINYINLNGKRYQILRDKELIERGIYAKTLIFIGTPSYFDSKFSQVFYGEEIFFLGYSCFENRLIKKQSFSDLTSPDNYINTIYQNVTVEKGYSGINYKDTFLKGNEEQSKKIIINDLDKSLESTSEGSIEVKLATISHNNFVFLPLKQKINVIIRDSLEITQKDIKDINIGDLLIFRDLNATSLVREEADKILGHKAIPYRESLEKWKMRLRFNVKQKGINKVSKILTEKYGIKVAKEENIKNWMEIDSIKPSCLSDLLDAFKFDSEEKSRILKAASEISSAHIAAGHYISRTLKGELNNNVENIIDENGYYSFKSKEFEGSYINIEEIKSISETTYFISEDSILKIIKG